MGWHARTVHNQRAYPAINFLIAFVLREATSLLRKFIFKMTSTVSYPANLLPHLILVTHIWLKSSVHAIQISFTMVQGAAKNKISLPYIRFRCDISLRSETMVRSQDNQGPDIWAATCVAQSRSIFYGKPLSRTGGSIDNVPLKRDAPANTFCRRQIEQYWETFSWHTESYNLRREIESCLPWWKEDEDTIIMRK